MSGNPEFRARCSVLDRDKERTLGLDRDKVVGTWDFKWAQQTRLKLAFLRPTGPRRGVENMAREQVEKALSSWQLEKTSLSAECRPGWLDPMMPYESKEARDYDILVSLDSLPFSPATREDEPDLEPVTLPEGELGAYNRRVDYGIPGVYVGFSPKLGLKDANGQTIETAEQYFRDDVCLAIATHELGHALGLLHPHQIEGVVQLTGKPLRSEEEILRVLNDRYGEDTARELHQPLVNFWPGNAAFSDYPLDKFKNGEPALRGNPLAELLGGSPDTAMDFILNSVMSIPLVASLFERDGAERLITAPSDLDLKLLQAIYPARRMD